MSYFNVLEEYVYHLFLKFLSDVHLMSEEEFLNLPEEEAEVYVDDYLGRLKS